MNMPKSKLETTIACLLAIAAMVMLDQGSKAAACALLPQFEGGDELFAAGTLLNAEFGMAKALIITVGLAFYAYAWSLNLPKPILCMWTAGGMSNLVELAIRGSVVDFIGFNTEPDHFLVFNLADVMIAMGFVALIGYAIAGRVRATDMVMGSAFLSPEDWGRVEVPNKTEDKENDVAEQEQEAEPQ